MYKVFIAKAAHDDIRIAFDWWCEHRSSDDAERWSDGIYPAMQSLNELPERYPLSEETNLHPLGLRELHYGIGRRPTPRIIFTIDIDTVIVLRVRHSAQGRLTQDDLL